MGSGESKADLGARNDVIENANMNRLRADEIKQQEFIKKLEAQNERDRINRAEAMRMLKEEKESLRSRERELTNDASRTEEFQIARHDRLQRENNDATERANIRNREDLERNREYHDAKLQQEILRNAEEIKELKRTNMEAEKIAKKQLEKLWKEEKELNDKIVEETKRHTELQAQQQSKNLGELEDLQKEHGQIEHQGTENVKAIIYQIDNLRVQGGVMQMNTLEAHKKETDEVNYVQLIANVKAAVDRASDPINKIMLLKRAIEVKQTGNNFVRTKIKVQNALRALEPIGETVKRELAALVGSNETNIDEQILERQEIAKEAQKLLPDLVEMLNVLDNEFTGLDSLDTPHSITTQDIEDIKKAYKDMCDIIRSIPAAYVKPGTQQAIVDNIRTIGNMGSFQTETRRTISEKNQHLPSITYKDDDEQDSPIE